MKLLERTPKAYMCGSCSCGCPAVFETDRGTYVIIGKKAEMSFKVANDEKVIVIDKGMLHDI